MARGINKCILVGNLGGDPEVRYTGNGTCVTEISVATSEQWTDKQSGERQERTEWTRCTLWGKLGEIAGEYLKKGRQVYIEGSLRTDKYTDKDGIERFVTKVVVSEMQMLGGGGDREGGGQGNGGQTRQGSSRPQDRNTQLDQRDSGQSRSGYGVQQQRQSAPPQQQQDLDDDTIPF